MTGPSRSWLTDGGLLRWPDQRPYDATAVDAAAPGIWRYRSTLGLPDEARRVTLGEGGTPLVRAALGGATQGGATQGGAEIAYKLEFAQPTGSYKDRGFAALFSALASEGVTDVVEDSSGNAGASAAAYGAAAGIGVTLFVPRAAADGVRVAQARAYGAIIDAEAPTRAAAAERACAAAEAGAVYASHVYQPMYLVGLQTIAYELFEQLGGAPDDVVVPVGHGGLLLGLALGFDALLAGGHITRLPRLHGVQAAAAAPLADAFASGAGAPMPLPHPPTATSAGGIAIGDPPRGAAVLAAVRRSRGTLSALAEDDITSAQASLARRGWYVEATSAVVAPLAERLAERLATGLARERSSGVVVAVLTGSGLKDAPVADARASGSTILLARNSHTEDRYAARRR